MLARTSRHLGITGSRSLVVRTGRLLLTSQRGFATKQVRSANPAESDSHISQYLAHVGKFEGRKNYGINQLPSGHQYVIERFGKFIKVENPGLCFLIPFIDKIAYVINRQELCLRISNATVMTRDDVTISVGGNLYVRFTDAEKAAYGAAYPIHAVMGLAQSAMRAAVGSRNLSGNKSDESEQTTTAPDAQSQPDQTNQTIDHNKKGGLNSQRVVLGNEVKNALNEGAAMWGGEIIRFVITDLRAIDEHVEEALHKQASAEREKKETQLRADAYAYKQGKEAEGDAAKVRATANAEADKIMALANAEAKSIEAINAELAKPGGHEAMQARITLAYIEAIRAMGASNNSTIVVPHSVGDISGMFASVKALFGHMSSTQGSTR